MATKIINGALAVFVKTPEYSPIKTRLAAQIGKTKALAIYNAMLHVAAAVMRTVQAHGIAVWWAVAEEKALAHPRWKEFPTMHSGQGGLGSRLHHVYSTLQAQYGRVALIGSDCPQMSATAVAEALNLARKNTVIGPSQDGGFYLFAAARDIPANVWLDVAYSRDDTLTQLLRALDDTTTRLPILTDIDDTDSLHVATKKLRHADLLEQRKLAEVLTNIKQV